MSRHASWRGQAMVDYLLVLTLLGVAFFFGIDSMLMRVVDAIAEHHQRFTWAISQP